MNDFELEMQRGIIEGKENWRTICNDIPALHFKKEWNVKICPPFGGVVARFAVEYNGIQVSVFLDWFGRASLLNKPYYEIYDGEEIRRYLLNSTDEMIDDIDKILNGTSIRELYEM